MANPWNIKCCYIIFPRRGTVVQSKTPIVTMPPQITDRAEGSSDNQHLRRQITGVSSSASTLVEGRSLAPRLQAARTTPVPFTTGDPNTSPLPFGEPARGQYRRIADRLLGRFKARHSRHHRLRILPRFEQNILLL